MPNEIVTAKLKVSEKVYYQKERCLTMSYWQKQSQNKLVIMLSSFYGTFDVLQRKKADKTILAIVGMWVGGRGGGGGDKGRRSVVGIEVRVLQSSDGFIHI